MDILWYTNMPASDPCWNVWHTRDLNLYTGQPTVALGSSDAGYYKWISRVLFDNCLKRNSSNRITWISAPIGNGKKWCIGASISMATWRHSQNRATIIRMNDKQNDLCQSTISRKLHQHIQNNAVTLRPRSSGSYDFSFHTFVLIPLFKWVAMKWYLALNGSGLQYIPVLLKVCLLSLSQN